MSGWSKVSRERSAERMRKLNADPAFKEASAERMRKLNADPAFKEAHAERSAERMRKLNADRRGFDVPAWVDRFGLRDDFIDVASVHGEEAAASHCRDLKRQGVSA